MMKWLWPILLLGGACQAQLVPFTLSSPDPGAQMSVCTYPANGFPCTNFTNLFAVGDGSSTLSNPVNLGPFGNVLIYANPGFYHMQLSGGARGYEQDIIYLPATGINVNGSSNVSVGVAACNLVGKSGGSNVCLGHAAGNALNTGNDTVLIGDAAGFTITSGAHIVCIGDNTCGSIVSGINDTVVGSSALFQSGNDVSDATIFGHGAMARFTAGGAIGTVCVGNDCMNGNGSGLFNTGLGQDALEGANGPGCTQGTATLWSGVDNVGVGNGALCNISGATSDNTAVGFQVGVPTSGIFTGSNNVLIGSKAAQGQGATISAHDNVIIGFQANYSASNRINAIAIGSGSNANEDNKAILGNGSVAALSIGGNFGFSKPGGTVFCGNGFNGDPSCTFQAAQLQTGVNVGIFDPHIVVTPSGDYGFTGSGNYTGSRDVNISRLAAGQIGVGNGTVGDSTGQLKLLTVQVGITVVGSLPTCNGTIEGSIRGVSDANSTTFHATAAGGGANHVKVYCNGTNWVIGG